MSACQLRALVDDMERVLNKGPIMGFNRQIGKWRDELESIIGSKP